jgi:phytanoyl-CoA hydroxylase
MEKIEKKYFTLGSELSSEQLDFFDLNGYILFKGFLPAEKTDELKSEMKRVEKKWLDEGLEKINGVPIKFGKNENGNKIVQRFCFLSQYSPVFHEILQLPGIRLLPGFLHPYQGRIAEDEKDGLVLNNYIRTPESKFTHMGWHTDCLRDLLMGHRIMPMLNVGIHLDDCPYTNGGLRILPGTHKQGFLKLLFGKKYFIDKDPDPREVGFNIHAGDLTVHDGRIWHRVEQSPYTGIKSQRRVMYVPIVTGNYQPKTTKSKTPLYHYFTEKAHH